MESTILFWLEVVELINEYTRGGAAENRKRQSKFFKITLVDKPEKNISLRHSSTGYRQTRFLKSAHKCSAFVWLAYSTPIV